MAECAIHDGLDYISQSSRLQAVRCGHDSVVSTSTHPGQGVLASFAVLATASDQRAIAGLVLKGIRENDSLQDRLLLRIHPGRRRVLVCECCVTGEMGVLQNVRRHVRDARESEETGPLMLMPGSYARGYRVV